MEAPYREIAAGSLSIATAPGKAYVRRDPCPGKIVWHITCGSHRDLV